MKYIKRISLIVVAVLVLACSVPLSSMAIDPVSAATMANAFAQAITAYGASQGVSMTFDVTNTDGIGEGVHDLWDQYAADMAQSNVTVSDYSNLAASVFPTLWKKTFDYVTVSLDAAAVGEIDGFWNWLLSGPAEMTKVDNQYYEWTIDSQTGNVLPISVYAASSTEILGYPVYPMSDTYAFYTNGGSRVVISSTGYPIYGVQWANVQQDSYGLYIIGFSNYYITSTINGNNQGSGNLTRLTSNNNVYYRYPFTLAAIQNNCLFPVCYDIDAFQAALTNATNQDLAPVLENSDIDVQPYVGDTAPQNVYIPDNTDVNYTPVAAEIPINLLWDDSLFGDGTGTLSDAQSEAITQAADQAITENPAKTLELADTVNPPAPSPSEVYIPFLPVTLPSFQFSLSGIWHYVTAWVASLGAWFSLVFTTWSYLPYAISVPVYATAVIVIVLGVYKRFFM